MRKALLVVVFALVAGCGNQYRDNHVYVWIAPEHPEFTRRLFLDGCRFWDGFGQTCDLVEYIGDADITVGFTEGDCGDVLAWCENNVTDWSHIVICARRYFDDKGVFQAHALKLTMAHEIGHALGLQHIPPTCDLDGFLWEQENVDSKLQIRRASNGKIVCGQAVMNPRIDDKLNAITEIDKMNFDLRDRPRAVLNPVGPTLGEPQ